jgi:hypothetical protein
MRTESETANPAARLRNSSACAISARALGSSDVPAWVSATERRSRSNNCTLEVAFERFDLL